MTEIAVTAVANSIEVVITEVPEIHVSIGDAAEVTVEQRSDIHDIAINDVTAQVSTVSNEVAINYAEGDEIAVLLASNTIEASVMTSSIEIDVGVGIMTPMEVIDFPSPTTTWTVDVGRMVDVVVINSAGQVVWPGEIVYGPGTRVTMEFSFPFSGQVHCYS